LSPERLARYSRQLLLPGFGELGQRRLQAARVLVVGAGGLGSATVPYLASAGVGTIGIADADTVELSNLHRQTAHTMADIGAAKVDSLAQTVAAIDPDIVVTKHAVRLTSTNIMGILDDYDLIVDGSDNFPTRYLSNDAATLAHKPLVWGAILRYNGHAGVSWAEHGPTYRDLFPVPPAADEVLSCELGGVLPGVCAAIGAILSTEVVKIITGVGEPLLGRVTTFDALTGRYREIEYASIPDAEPITGLIDYEQFCGVASEEPKSSHAAPAAELNIDAQELERMLRSGTQLQLIDVREPVEADIVALPGSELIPLGELESSVAKIRTDVPVVVYCHHGPRSLYATRMLRALGYENVSNLAGGIDAYATVQPGLARY
jgi:adenylyltransferase/sulfurtransferase